MGPNIYFLSDFAVPSYRRARARQINGTALAAGDRWAGLARQRAAQRQHLHAVPQAVPALQAVQGVAVLPAAPVRVTRVPESGQSSGAAGRLRISGRLADVCAELERLAANDPGVPPAA